MKLSNVPFGVVDWSTVEPVTHPGDTGHAEWRTRHIGDLRVRMVRYTENYSADHWCSEATSFYACPADW